MKKVIAAAGASLLLLSACSSGGGGGTTAPPASSPSSTSTPATPAVRSADELVAAMRKAASGTGAFTFHTSLVGPDGPIADVDGNVASKPPVMASVRRNDSSGFMSWLLVDGKGYQQGDGITDGYWQRSTAREEKTLFAEYTTDLVFRALDAGAQKVTFVGRETLTGTKTLKYVFVVDTAKALAAEGEAPSKGLPPTLDFTMWVDDKDLPVKLSYEQAGVAVTSEYGWGEPLELVAPPDDRVLPAPRTGSGG